MRQLLMDSLFFLKWIRKKIKIIFKKLLLCCSIYLKLLNMKIIYFILRLFHGFILYFWINISIHVPKTLYTKMNLLHINMFTQCVCRYLVHSRKLKRYISYNKVGNYILYIYELALSSDIRRYTISQAFSSL